MVSLTPKVAVLKTIEITNINIEFGKLLLICLSISDQGREDNNVEEGKSIMLLIAFNSFDKFINDSVVKQSRDNCKSCSMLEIIESYK